MGYEQREVSCDGLFMATGVSPIATFSHAFGRVKAG